MQNTVNDFATTERQYFRNEKQTSFLSMTTRTPRTNIDTIILMMNAHAGEHPQYNNKAATKKFKDIMIELMI